MVGVVAVGLVACGGGSGTGANSGTATTINGIAVPPAPDAAANNATLAGVDSNGNGVRDDAERLVAGLSIKTNYTDVNLEIAKQYSALVAADDKFSKDQYGEAMRKIYCLNGKRTNDEQSLLQLEVIFESVINTEDRKAKYYSLEQKYKNAFSVGGVTCTQ